MILNHFRVHFRYYNNIVSRSVNKQTKMKIYMYYMNELVNSKSKSMNTEFLPNVDQMHKYSPFFFFI